MGNTLKIMAIIGTAGRQSDALKLTRRHWDEMVKAARGLIQAEGIDESISGGAAWSDHVAIELAPETPTTIWLPAFPRDLDTAAYYHRKFSQAIGRETYREIQMAADAGHAKIHSFGGFKDRNSKVADAAHTFLAITFGRGANVQDGGTADTVRKMRAAGKTGFHFDLNDFTLHKVA